MNKLYSLEEEFESIVLRIFQKNSFEVENIRSYISSSKNYRCDFEIKYEKKRGFVDVKLYRSKLADLNLVTNACRQLLSINIPHKIPVLIISSVVSEPFKEKVQKEWGVLIWDIRDLFALSFEFSELYCELESLSFGIFGESAREFSIINTEKKEQIILNFKNFITSKTPNKAIVDTQSIKKLSQELSKITAGRKYFQQFERKCTEILHYLFRDDLDLWKKQEETSDNLHRYDLLCRIKLTKNIFWNELSKDFNCRYIVFEFKNYTHKITQKEIYSTEKYLFKTALRSVAFIVARNDADEHAYYAASGALRENGKLIVILTTKNLKEMIVNKEKGDDPTDLLRYKIDEILIKMSR